MEERVLHNTNGYCGDGYFDNPNLGETCDDGNTIGGDGCDATCNPETGWTCATTVTHSDCTEDADDGAWMGSLECDDGDGDDTNGCTNDGTTVNAGFYCEPGVVGLTDTCTECCSDGVEAGVLGCDDGNIVNGDGCSDTCTIEPGFDCTTTPGTCTELCEIGFAANDHGGFACKDGNDLSGDGCSFDCLVETGFFCHGGSYDRADDCEERCGD